MKKRYVCATVTLAMGLMLSGCNESKEAVIDSESVAITEELNNETQISVIEEVEEVNNMSEVEDESSEEATSIIEEEVNAETKTYYGSVDDVIEVDDGYIIKFSNTVYYPVVRFTLDEYKELENNLEYPIDDFYKKEGYYCCEHGSDGYYYIPNFCESLEETLEDGTLAAIWISDKNTDDEGLIVPYIKSLNSLYGDEWFPYEEISVEVGKIEFTVPADCPVYLISELVRFKNGYLAEHKEPISMKEEYENAYEAFYGNDGLYWNGFSNMLIIVNDDNVAVELREINPAG